MRRIEGVLGAIVGVLAAISMAERAQGDSGVPTVWRFDTFGSSSSRSCPPPVMADGHKREAEIEADLKASLKEERHCDAHELAHQLRMKHEETPREATRFTRLAVSELMKAGDFRGATTYALSAMNDETMEIAKDEQIRFLVLQSVHAASQELGNQKDPTWTRYGLGFSRVSDPRLGALVFESFLMDFPASKKRLEVERMQSATLDLFVASELEVAKLLMVREQYMAVIQRLEGLYRIPQIRSSKGLEDIMSTVIKAQLKFADEILNPPWIKFQYKWSDERLRAVFAIAPGEKVDRAELAALLETKAGQACGFLVENRKPAPAECKGR